MTIKDIGVFRDGGTTRIETDQGVYWIPALNYNKRQVFKGENYFKYDCVEVTDENEIFELIFKLCDPAAFYFSIKRSYFNDKD